MYFECTLVAIFFHCRNCLQYHFLNLAVMIQCGQINDRYEASRVDLKSATIVDISLIIVPIFIMQQLTMGILR
jgi:hypothetical protein